MNKKIPKLKSDKEAEDFLEKDLTDYIHLKKFQKFLLSFSRKQKR